MSTHAPDPGDGRTERLDVPNPCPNTDRPDPDGVAAVFAELLALTAGSGTGFLPVPDTALYGRKAAIRPVYADQGDPGDVPDGPEPDLWEQLRSNPNVVLQRIRHAQHDLDQARADLVTAGDDSGALASAARRLQTSVALLATAVAEIDAHLCAGGRLPADWARATRGAR